MSKASDIQVGGQHYKSLPIQPAKFLAANGIPFLEGCVIKRMCRWRSKNGLEDLLKAKHEIDLIIEYHSPVKKTKPRKPTQKKR
jgi:hypothetical protein